MPYTTKDATQTFLGYLGVDEAQAEFIPSSSNRGLLYSLDSGEKCVIFIYPISHKADNTKNFFDTRDSGATERAASWKYAQKNGLKYFCLAVHDQVDRYKDYVFSLECDEKVVQDVSGVINGVKRAGGGTQVVIPNDYIPSKEFDRIKTRNDFWIAVIHRNSIKDYLEKFDSRPYLQVAGGEQNSSEMDEYQLAAKTITDHIAEMGVQFNETAEEIQQAYDDFLAKFSPEKLSALTDDVLLKSVFYSSDSNNDSLCYWLEFHTQVRSYFGSIAGGSALKFGLYQKKEDGKWYTGSPVKQEELTNDTALELGKHIRDCLVKGAKIIGEATLETPADYNALDKTLNEAIGKYAFYGWFQKYFQMVHPDKIVNFYSTDWHNHILYALGIKPSDSYYGRNGQVTIIRRYTGLPNPFFGEAFYDKFGMIKHFFRLGSTDGNEKYAKEWRKKNLVAVGWRDIGSLEDYLLGNTLNRKSITETLGAKYYPDNASVASRKAGEIVNFYKADSDSIFVVMDGEQLIAFVDNPRDYYYDANEDMAHRRPGIWHNSFKAEDELPYKSEGHMTTCVELTNTDNMLYLYKKYYYELDEVEDDAMNTEEPFVPVNYDTGLHTEFSLNRIVFGAPGTGKSYELEQDRKKILQNGNIGDFERVTFHPDYSYSQFVGTYKPVTDEKDNIRYQFVPGPFMRIYVKALKNGRELNPQPYVLLIEEINRARVAAVFGDIFQLLDRCDSGVSMYEIQTSEDVRKYLAKELGGSQDNYRKIMLPNNMFIWATMNSADQGVFPMDTAFKRRWDFEYLGIDANEEMVTATVELIDGTPESSVKWNCLRKAINDKLAKEYKINEDKLLGPFFLSSCVIAPVSDDDTQMAFPERFRDSFKSKVIMYLYEDAAKQYRQKLFSGCDSTKYSSVCDAFDKIGMDIFGESFKNDYYDQQVG